MPRILLSAIAVAILLAASGAPAALAAIAIPWIGQKTATDCGRAVLAALAGRRSGNAEAAYRRLPDPPDPVNGYSINDMRRFGAKVGVGLTLRAPGGVVIAGDCSPRPAVAAHMAALARTVAGGRPVVVPVSSGFTGGHYLILVGASGGSFTAHDPASPGLREISSDQLASRMCAYGYLALAA